MIKKYNVTLTETERQQVHAVISKGKAAARRLIHGRVLLKADQGWPDPAICEAVEVRCPTVERLRKRFVEEGFDAALDPQRPIRPCEHKIDGDVEAHLIALARGTPPIGQTRGPCACSRPSLSN